MNWCGTVYTHTIVNFIKQKTRFAKQSFKYKLFYLINFFLILKIKNLKRISFFLQLLKKYYYF